MPKFNFLPMEFGPVLVLGRFFDPGLSRICDCIVHVQSEAIQRLAVRITSVHDVKHESVHTCHQGVCLCDAHGLILERHCGEPCLGIAFS